MTGRILIALAALFVQGTLAQLTSIPLPNVCNGNPCPLGATCVNNQCQCPTGMKVCGNNCVDTQTDVNNCGVCDKACSGGITSAGLGYACNAGFCGCKGGASRVGVEMCYIPLYDGSKFSNMYVCPNLMNDTQNCGVCGNTCPPNTICNNGVCDCPPDVPGKFVLQKCAKGTGNKVCTNVLTDPDNCGKCGREVPQGATCTAGQITCPSGLTLCGNQCVDTASDYNNCGSCGNQCNAPQSSQSYAFGSVCLNGACNCPAGQQPCPPVSNGGSRWHCAASCS